MKVTIYTNVVDGVIKRNRKSLAESIKQFNGKEITITIEKKKKKRSNEQNKYYWGVLVILIKNAIRETWGENMTTLQVHEMLKKELNFIEKVNENTGEVIKIAKSTTENSTVDMENYHEDCRKFAKDWFNVEIPLPNEDLTLEL